MKLLETIRFENGKFANPELHQKRMNATRKDLFSAEEPIDLEKELAGRKPATAPHPPGLLYKCRVLYSEQIQRVEFTPYSLPKIRSLKLVVDNSITYAHKFLDRRRLEKLFAQKGDCDDILIVRDGLITDTSLANVLFYNGSQWLTPARPLLKGTQRQLLLENEKIATAEIRHGDLKYFQKARLVNAMMRFEDAVEVDISEIITL